jgi:alpha-tubulin suppressor-like RCC1 family protein
LTALRLLAVTAGAVALAATAGSGRAERQAAPVPATAIAAGLSHTCALTNVGAVECWGYNGHDELGNGQDGDSATPVGVSGLDRGVASIAAGVRHSCAVTSAGGAKCWGYGRGPLGDGTSGRRRTAVDVSGLTTGVAAVTAGNDYSCALTSAGGVKCWGSNFGGQLGDGTTIERLAPVDVAGLSGGVKAIAAGLSSCALTAAGGVKCWGGGRLAPVDVPGLGSAVTAITPRCALMTGGGVKCWGNDLVPVDVPGLSSGVTAISSTFHSCALLDTGGVKCWGLNDHGQLGDGTTTDRPNPVNVAGLHGRAKAISAGSFHTCALLSTGAVDCWGAVSGQLGGDSQSIVLRPVAVAGFGTAKASLAIVSRSVRVTPARVAPIVVRCGSQVLCRGKVALDAGGTQLGSRRFAIATDSVEAIRVKLTPAGFRALTRRRRLSTHVAVTGGVKATRTITLVAP